MKRLLYFNLTCHADRNGLTPGEMTHYENIALLTGPVGKLPRGLWKHSNYLTSADDGDVVMTSASRPKYVSSRESIVRLSSAQINFDAAGEAFDLYCDGSEAGPASCRDVARRP